MPRVASRARRRSLKPPATLVSPRPGKNSPSSRHSRLQRLSSIAFIGLPWPTNRAGMRGVADRSASVVTSRSSITDGETTATVRRLFDLVDQRDRIVFKRDATAVRADQELIAA